MGISFKLNDNFKATMMNEFEMKDLGLMQYFPRMEMHKINDNIFIFQTKYVKVVLKSMAWIVINQSLLP